MKMLQVPDRNTKELLDLASFFEELDPALYTQVQFRSGEARCICGWCNERQGRLADDQQAARKTLGLTQEASASLFRGDAGQTRSWMGMVAPTPKDAARVLRHLAVTGELADW
jgi:hypothetical protein